MNGAHLLQGQQVPVGPPARVESLPVHPTGRIGVTLHLHVLTEFLGPDGPALIQELADLVQDHGVSLQGRGVVRLLMPQVVPDVLGLHGGGQPAQVLVEVVDGLVQAGVDRSAGRSTTGH